VGLPEKATRAGSAAVKVHIMMVGRKSFRKEFAATF
jgi:hypothetical protein